MSAATAAGDLAALLCDRRDSRKALAEVEGRRNYAEWSHRAPFTCGTCGAVSNFPCYHQRGALHEGDHIRVQRGGVIFGATVRVIVTGDHGGIADVEPDDEPGRVVSVSFGTAAASQITPIGSAA